MPNPIARRAAHAACLLAILVLVPARSSTAQQAVPEQPDFVADLVVVNRGRVERGRIAHRAGAFRVEALSAPGGPARVYIFREGGPAVVVGPTGEHETVADAGFLRLLAPWLWLDRLDDEPGMRLEPAGDASVDGHPCQRLIWRGDESGGGPLTLYVARDLEGLVLRVELPNAGDAFFRMADTYELQNVTLGAPEELFRPPPGSREVDGVGSGDRPAPDLEREIKPAPVLLRRARVTGLEPHATVDTDGDGLFDAVELRPRVELSGPDEVTVFAEVRGPNGRSARAEAKAAASGVVAVRVAASVFVKRIGVDGPYTARVGVVEPLAPALFAEVAPERLEYRVEQFDGSGLEILGVGTARGVDADGNGLFEQIEVPVAVRVGRRGRYTSTACLWVEGSGMSGTGVGRARLKRGRGTIVLKFNAYEVREQVAGRPYSLGCLAAYGEGEGAMATEKFELVQLGMDTLESRGGDTSEPHVEVDVEPSVVRATGELVEVRVTGSVGPGRGPKLRGQICWVEGGAERVSGDRRTTSDVEVLSERRLRVRAELPEGASERVYTIGYCARDLAGNVGTATATVRVVP